ncbi:uncharacterized protein CXorf65 homolog isoform X1 [Diadema antillarum]|uniref:uncharacterized protein CXorf65 homolog n=1 Tax=Diadema antillarum TaxID=105358 RepID=UPI003A88D198
MFITVKYGEKEEALFNPYCKTMLLLEDIKKRCKCSTNVQVDLSDQEGNVKHLTDAPLRYANELLKERESFVLIRVEREDDNQKPQYTPLLNDDQAIDAAFLARLSTKDNLGLHSAKTNMRKKGRSSDRGRDSQRGRTGAKSTTPTGRRKSEKR